MESNIGNGIQEVRYEPDERPPTALSIGLGLQYATLTVASIVLTPAILVGAAGGEMRRICHGSCAPRLWSAE